MSVSLGEDLGSERFKLLLWLMSCRVLKRGMEQAMMDSLVGRCRSRCIEKESTEFICRRQKTVWCPTSYGTLGFDKVSEDVTGSTVWQLTVTSASSSRNRFIKVCE